MDYPAETQSNVFRREQSNIYHPRIPISLSRQETVSPALQQTLEALSLSIYIPSYTPATSNTFFSTHKTKRKQNILYTPTTPLPFFNLRALPPCPFLSLYIPGPVVF
jgi:hypothetical protein